MAESPAPSGSRSGSPSGDLSEPPSPPPPASEATAAAAASPEPVDSDILNQIYVALQQQGELIGDLAQRISVVEAPPPVLLAPPPRLLHPPHVTVRDAPRRSSVKWTPGSSSPLPPPSFASAGGEPEYPGSVGLHSPLGDLEVFAPPLGADESALDAHTAAVALALEKATPPPLSTALSSTVRLLALPARIPTSGPSS